MFKRQLLNICTSLDSGTIFRLHLCTVLPIKEDTAVPETYSVCLLTFKIPCDYEFVSFVPYQLKSHKKTIFKAEDLIRLCTRFWFNIYVHCFQNYYNYYLFILCSVVSLYHNVQCTVSNYHHIYVKMLIPVATVSNIM